MYLSDPLLHVVVYALSHPPLRDCLFDLLTGVLFPKVDCEVVYTQKYRSSRGNRRSSRHPASEQGSESLIPEDLC